MALSCFVVVLPPLAMVVSDYLLVVFLFIGILRVEGAPFRLEPHITCFLLSSNTLNLP